MGKLYTKYTVFTYTGEDSTHNTKLLQFTLLSYKDYLRSTGSSTYHSQSTSTESFIDTKYKSK